MAAMAHGTVESILFALANSSAPALCGLNRSDEVEEAPPGDNVGVSPLAATSRREGERNGEEKDKR